MFLNASKQITYNLFCRFHPLSEFDEGKRSCRRRLAGHNRRRRKTQPDDVTSKLLPPGNRENVSTGDVDLVNLLAILARAQGTIFSYISLFGSLVLLCEYMSPICCVHTSVMSKKA